MPSAVKSPVLEARTTPTQNETRPPKRKLRWGFVGIALAALVCLDTSARIFYKPDPYASPNRSWVWWSVRDFRLNKKQVDVAVFGSSLMQAAINDGDSTYLGKGFDAITHHRAVYLEKLASDRLKRPISTSTFAIGGQMASDVYALLSSIFNDRPVPKQLIWGIAPRDFIDSTFTNPDESETVRYTNKIAGSTNILKRKRFIFWDELEYFFDRAFYLYGKRQDVVVDTLPIAKFIVSSCRKHMNLETVRTLPVLWQCNLASLPDDNGLDEWHVTPWYPNKHFPDNTDEYKVRYQPFHPNILKTQLDYCRKMLALAKEKNLRVTIINMPLTKRNLALLPAGVYDQYLSSVRSIATEGGAEFLDLNHSEQFKDIEFADSVHLNGLGGEHFFEAIEGVIR